ncbi:class I SAM-dependent DNA methyltransferase [Bittarella massiliensis (ex Durand et al. 2017)]|uniref:class I SAM-dependent DNA methyltransferase n=1 Tax=Bittarella massiliensis (ex Durand et al. 2017) TaxID=1720313 RepID=UPI00073EFFCB|nr:class I SAM-dependent methyltransferase [Bittarella massiliensis (ex Durand et al. 2017)]
MKDRQQNFYGNFAGFYDALTENVDRARMAGFIVEKLAEQGIGGGIVLDAGCGTGELCLRLARAGYDLIGADPSEEMLEIARERVMGSGEDILLLGQGMEELDLYGTIRAAVSTLDTVNHLPDREAVRRAFSRVSLFMEEGGVFLFDVNTRYKHAQVLGNNAYLYDLGDLYCGWQNEWREEEGVTDISLTFFEEGEDGRFDRYDECFSETWYAPEFLQTALEEAGFALLQRFDGYRDRPVTEKSQRVVYLAKKEGK